MGFKVGVIPVGIMGHTKMHEDMPILIREDLYEKEKDLVGELMVRASSSLSANAIMLANRDVSRLEPELADWFFGEKNIARFTGTDTELTSVMDELREKKILFSATYDETGPAVVALHPIVQSSFLELEHDLEHIEHD
jgi:hypothetical protein